MIPPDTKRRGAPARKRPSSLVAVQATVTTPHPTPRVAGRLVERRKGGWSLIVEQCPFCGAAHTHGAPGGEQTREASRVSHCWRVDVRTYRIVVGAGQEAAR